MTAAGVKFDWEMSLKSDELVGRADKLILETRKIYEQVGNLKKNELNFENLLKVLSDAECEYTSERYNLDFPQHVAPNKEVRDASTEADKKMQEFDVEIGMRQDIFDNLVAFEAKKPQLDSEYQRYLERLINLGKRNGLHLEPSIQEEVKGLKSRINNLCIQFTKNLGEEDTKLEFTDEELKGLPEEFISNLELLSNGKRLVTLKYPHYFPVMRKSKNPKTRQLMEQAFNSKCMEQNTPILEEIITLRDKQAKLLGFKTHAAYIADFRMSKTEENIHNFLTDIASKLKPLWENEEKELLELKQKECEELDLSFDGKLNPYDLSYYTTKIEETKYKVDQEQIRKYFPLPTLTQKVLDIYQLILGLKFKEVEGAKVWHPDVKLYSVTDAQSDLLLGYFFLDLFPREGKYGHAALFELQPGCLLADGSRQVGIGALVTNFTKSNDKDKPSLLDHSEVTTLFHEFGHVMHFVCAQANLCRFYGVQVERDFVEAPSQMLENWCWEEESLKFLSSHYLEKNPLPDDITSLLIKSRKANTGFKNLRQIVLSEFDQEIHKRGQANTKEIFANIQKKYLHIEPSPNTNFAANFGHLVGDYDAQYYGYMWSEVYSMDMFASRFKKEGVLSPKVGKDYREKILQPGGSKDAIDMLTDFLGRKPKSDAFLINKGIQIV